MPGLVQLQDKIVVRFALTIYPYSLGADLASEIQDESESDPGFWSSGFLMDAELQTTFDPMDRSAKSRTVRLQPPARSSQEMRT